MLFHNDGTAVCFAEDFSLQNDRNHPPPGIREAVKGGSDGGFPKVPHRTLRRRTWRTILGYRWMPFTCSRPEARKADNSESNERCGSLIRAAANCSKRDGLNYPERPGRKQGRPGREDSADGRHSALRSRVCGDRDSSKADARAMQSRRAPSHSRRMPALGALRGTPRWNGERETHRLPRGESRFPDTTRITVRETPAISWCFVRSPQSPNPIRNRSLLRKLLFPKATVPVTR